MSIGTHIGSPTKRAHKQALYEDQGGVCPLCSQHMPREMKGAMPNNKNKHDLPTLDHIKRLRDGGLWIRSNLQLVHWKCNANKA